MAPSKHWLMQTPKELLGTINQQQNKNFVVLKTNVYLFQGDHVLLLHQRDLPAAGHDEEWVVPRDVERIDRPGSHPTQKLAITVPLRNRILTGLARMQTPPQALREIQFLEFSKLEPLSLPDGDTLHIWCILSIYDTPQNSDLRAAFLTHLNPAAKYRWVSQSDLDLHVKTPATDTDRTNQLHILDLKNAFLRRDLCTKQAIIFEAHAHNIPTVCQHIIAAVVEARVASWGEQARQGMVLLTSKARPPHFVVRNLRMEQMRMDEWPEGIPGKEEEAYRIIAGFMGGMMKWKE
ncbi:hypothetical protein DOTSEDRAFT_83010, partial [Dothistroma septosporum NZE10]